MGGDQLTNHHHLPRVPVGKLDGHDGPVTAVRFVGGQNKKGYCLTAGGHDRLIKLWNPFRVDPASSVGPRKKKRKDSPTNKRPREDSYYGDGVDDNAGSNSRISSYDDLPSCLEIQTYKFFAHEVSAINSCMSSPSSSSSSHDILLAASKNTFVVADLVTNSTIRRLGSSHHTGRINDICAFDGNSNSGGGSQLYLTASYDATVAIWDARARNNHQPIQILRDATDSVSCVLVGRDNQALIRTGSVDGIVRTYDVRKGILTSDAMGHSQIGTMSSAPPASPITSMTMTHDGQCVVVNCLDGTIRLVEVETGELMNTYSGCHVAGSYGLDIAVLASDTTIATGSEDGRCVLYDLVSAQVVQELQGNLASGSAASGLLRRPTCNIAAHPSNNSVLITASYDNSVVVWADEKTAWEHQKHDQLQQQ